VLAQDANAERVNVLTASCAAARPPTSARARSRISAAALLVNVIAAIALGA
jgi:hypothetical protein